ncbi:MAG: hypothetical protein D6725_10000 [Planctomycetota bacterium]|nr:MAG: hypothetical protein D6725_10000 [Planctomycetota bacterium]
MRTQPVPLELGENPAPSPPSAFRIGMLDDDEDTQFHAQRLGLFFGAGIVPPDALPQVLRNGDRTELPPAGLSPTTAWQRVNRLPPVHAVICGVPERLSPDTVRAIQRSSSRLVLVGRAALAPPPSLAGIARSTRSDEADLSVFVCSPALGERTFCAAAHTLAEGRIGVLKTAFRAASLNHVPDPTGNIDVANGPHEAILRRRLAMLVQQAVWLLGAERDLRAVLTQSFEHGVAAVIRRCDGVAAHLLLDVSATLHCDTGWVLDTSDGGFANFHETRREPDGETYAVPVSCPHDPWSGIHADLIARCSAVAGGEPLGDRSEDPLWAATGTTGDVAPPGAPPDCGEHASDRLETVATKRPHEDTRSQNSPQGCLPSGVESLFALRPAQVAAALTETLLKAGSDAAAGPPRRTGTLDERS